MELKEIDAELWDDIERALIAAMADHCSPDFDELDCSIVLELVLRHRRHAAADWARIEFERYAQQMGLRDFEETSEDGIRSYRNPFTQGPWDFWRASRDAA